MMQRQTNKANCVFLVVKGITACFK